MPADRIVAAEDLWNRFPTPLVFDHLGHLPEPDGVNHPAFSVIRRLIDKDRAWVKISGAYIDTKIGPPTYADSTRVAQAYVKAAPERVVWGSDWPHPNLGPTEKPNDELLFDLLTEWAPNNVDRHRILVENPESLYGFPARVGNCRSEVEQVMQFSALRYFLETARLGSIRHAAEVLYVAPSAVSRQIGPNPLEWDGFVWCIGLRWDAAHSVVSGQLLRVAALTEHR